MHRNAWSDADGSSSSGGSGGSSNRACPWGTTQDFSPAFHLFSAQGAVCKPGRQLHQPPRAGAAHAERHATREGPRFHATLICRPALSARSAAASCCAPSLELACGDSVPLACQRSACLLTRRAGWLASALPLQPAAHWATASSSLTLSTALQQTTPSSPASHGR